MATSIGKLILQMQANTEQMTGDLDKGEKSVEQFGKKAASALAIPAPDVSKYKNALHGIEEKIGVAFGRRLAGGEFFKSMASDINAADKAAAGLSTSFGLVDSVLSKALRRATAFQALAVGSLAGLAFAGISWVLEKLKPVKDDAAAAAAELDEAAKRALARAATGGRTDVGPSTVTATPGGGATVETGRLGFLGGVTSTTLITPETVGASAATRELEGLTRSLDESTRAAGRTRAEMAVLAAETSFSFRRWDAGGAARRIAADLGDAAAAGRAALVRDAGSRDVTAIESATTRARDLAATMGMSADAAEDYRLSLRRTTRSIGDYTVETTEALSPTDMYARRIAELDRIEAATGVSTRRARAEAAAARDAEIEGLARLASARDTAARARARAELTDFTTAITTARETTLGGPSPEERNFERIARELRERMSAPRGLGGFFGDAMDIRALVAARDELGRLIDSRERLRLATPFEEATAEIDRMTAMLERGVITLDTFMRGMRRVSSAGVDTRGAYARLADDLARVDRAEGTARLAAAMRGVAFDASGFASDRADLIMRATAGGRLELPTGPGALEFGSAATISAINAARRSGPTDPIVRAVAILEAMRAAAMDADAVRRTIARAVTEGAIVVDRRGI